MAGGAFREIALLFGIQTDQPSFARADRAMAAFVAQQQKRAAAMDAAARPAKPSAEPFGKNAPEALKDSGFSLADGLTGQAGVIAGAAEKLANVLANAVQQVAELGSRLNRVGTGFKANLGELQAWEHAASRMGVSAESLTGTMSQLESKAYGAATGMDAGAVMAYGRLGVAIRNANGQIKSGQEQLDAVAERIKKLPNTIATQQKVIAVVGEELGRQLVGAVQSGRFDEWRKDFKDFGAELSGEGLAAVKRYGDEQSKLGLIMKGLRQSAAIPLIESLGRIGKTFTEKLRGDKSGQQALGKATAQFAKLEPIFARIADWLYKLLPVVGLVIEGFIAVGHVIGGVVGFVGDIIESVHGAGTMLAALGAALFAAFFPVTGMIAGIILILDDLMTFSKGGRSLFGMLIAKFMELDKYLSTTKSSDPWWLVAIKELYQNIKLLPAAWRMFIDEIEKTWDAVGKKIEKVLTLGGATRRFGEALAKTAETESPEDYRKRVTSKEAVMDDERRRRQTRIAFIEANPSERAGHEAELAELKRQEAAATAPAVRATVPAPEATVPTVPISSAAPGGSAGRVINVAPGAFAPNVTIHSSGPLKEDVERVKQQIADGLAEFGEQFAMQIGQAPQ